MDGDVERRAIVSIHPSRREPGARAEAARGARPYSAHPTAVHPVRARLAAAARHVAAHGAAPHRHRAALGGGRAPRAAGDKRHSRGSQRDLSRYRHRARLRMCQLTFPPRVQSSRHARRELRRADASWRHAEKGRPGGSSDSNLGSWMLRISQTSDGSSSATPPPRRSRPKEWANVANLPNRR